MIREIHCVLAKLLRPAQHTCASALP